MRKSSYESTVNRRWYTFNVEYITTVVVSKLACNIQGVINIETHTRRRPSPRSGGWRIVTVG